MLREHGGQGHAPGSAWARGTAWALHGFALSFRYTGEARYLETAERAADFFLAMLGEDIVPAWDFRAPAEHRAAWDSSAAAIAASGLLELAKLSPRGQTYAAAGERIVRGLYEHHSSAELSAEEGLILRGRCITPKDGASMCRLFTAIISIWKRWRSCVETRVYFKGNDIVRCSSFILNV